MSAVFAQDVSDMVASAAAQVRAGRLDDGAHLLEAALRLAPENAEALRWAGIVALERGDAARAGEIYERLATAPAPRADVLRGLGRARKALGDLDGAIAAYRRALDADPTAADVMVSLGIALKQQGDAAGAMAWFRQAATRNPVLAEAHHSLALLLKAEGRADEAIDAWRLAVSARPALTAAWMALARSLAEAGRAAEARDAYRGALRGDSRNAQAHYELGLVEQNIGGSADALPHFERAAELDPGLWEARHSAGLALFEAKRYDEAVPHLAAAVELHPGALEFGHLGDALRFGGRHAESIAAYERGIALDPLVAALQLGRGVSLQMLNRWQQAEGAFLKALEAGGENYAAHSNLAAMCVERGLFETAMPHLHAALEADPLSAEVRVNLAVALYMTQRPREALALVEEALARQPELSSAHLTQALAQLMLGDYASGWEKFEWRWRAHEGLAKGELRFAQPRWSGESLKGRILLLTHEQGLGDTLQFVRYAPLLSAMGAQVWLFVPKALARLLERVAGVSRVFVDGTPPAGFDVHCPVMSLPHLLCTRLETIPARIPYLSAEPNEQRAWRRRLDEATGGSPGLKVGLAWSGDPRPGDRAANLTDARRSVKLAQFAPLARVPGIHWVSLQKGTAAAEARQPPEGMRLIDLMDEAKDFADTAALVRNLDLVIAVDTSVVHLAAGLGTPVWMLSRFDGCWRWLLGRDDSPWYPGLRLFRQHASLDWSRAIESLAGALAARQSGPA